MNGAAESPPATTASATAAQARLDAYVATLAARYPGFAIVPKRGARSQALVGRLLALATLGAARGYVSSFHTTWGNRIYVCDGWERMDANARYVLLRHEAVHLAQFARYGTAGMAAIYAGWPLPVGLAYARARLEWAAYAETVTATLEVYGPAALTPALREDILSAFTGPDYGWMWPFRKQVARWYDAHVAALLATN